MFMTQSSPMFIIPIPMYHPTMLTTKNKSLCPLQALQDLTQMGLLSKGDLVARRVVRKRICSLERFCPPKSRGLWADLGRTDFLPVLLDRAGLGENPWQGWW